MKKIISNLKDHLKKDFRTGYYISIFIFLIVTITINYYYDFEDSVIDVYTGQEIRVLWYFLLYGFAYYTAVLINYFTTGNAILRNRKFWYLSLIGLAILSFSAGFPYTTYLANKFPRELEYLAYKIIYNLRSILVVLLPLYILYKYDKEKDGFYGFTFSNVNLKPYAVMLLIMLPLIVGASFQEDFLRSYPSYKPNEAAEFLQVPSWVTILVFELCYGWDFVAVELLFRGFMVIGIAKAVGKEAILPMVVTYAFLHFGKPLGETIGSVFGGYILGVIALYSRNIWGGVAIHLGVAWLMELAAFYQKIIS